MLHGPEIRLERKNAFRIEQKVNNKALFALVLRKTKNGHVRENPLGHTFEFLRDGRLLSTGGQNFVELAAPGVYKTRVDGCVCSDEI